jgi:hypothetical protein
MNIRRWAYFTALVMAFIGALIAVSGAWLVFVDQAQVQGERIWPLPGLILMDWAILGILGFIAVLLINRPHGSTWLKAIWFVIGALIPLVILGAFSIGPYVLITFLFFLATSVIIATQIKNKWLEYLGLVLLGIICNLGLYFLMLAVNSFYI